MARRRARVHQNDEQLEFPFMKRLVIDQNSQAKRIRDHPKPIDAVFTTDVGLENTAKDSEVASTALNAERWVFTADREFQYDAFKGGCIPPGIVGVPEELLADASKLSQVASDIRSIPSSLWNRSGTSQLPIMSYCNANELSFYRLPLPPESVQAILPEIDGTGRLSSKDLARIWKCNTSTARRRARELIQRGWLGVKKEGRQNRYYRGQDLVSFRKGTTIEEH